MTSLAKFSYDLPPELIAQEPAQPRGSGRLLLFPRDGAPLQDLRFADFPTLLRPGDLLVVNDTRVLPARLFGQKPTGGRVELLLLAREGQREWEALVRASKGARPGTRVLLGGGAEVEILEARGDGIFTIRLHSEESPEETLERLGRMPLPPYIRRDEPRAEDREWYQTVFARGSAGSAAAPTAGLHFTPDMVERIAALGVRTVNVTLDVGLGTFLPVRVDDLDRHEMHRERYHLPETTAAEVNKALDEGRRVVAVGTTATRVLEHCWLSGRVEPGEGFTTLFLRPGSRFHVVSALLTNFHLPESTLLMLVCAFAGTEATLAAYRHAVTERYRFFSYGDAMFIG